MMGQTKRGKQRLLFTCIVFAAAAWLSCCAPGKSSKEAENRRRIIDDYREIILLQDRDSADYDRILSEIGEYTEKPDPEKKEQVLSHIQDQIVKMEEEAGSYTPHVLEEDFQSLLEENGILPMEYNMNADGRYEMLSMYAQNLFFLEAYLQAGDLDEEGMEDLKLACSYYTEDQKDMRGYQYTGVNYWFAGWEEEEVEYIRETILDQFQSFAAEGQVWEESRDGVELRMNTYLNRMEARLDELSGRIGEKQEKLYEMEQEAH